MTKAAGDTFASTSVFETNAYYLATGSKWTDSASESVEYIHENTVRWKDNAWRMKEEHHWPEAGGNLTFYSWTLNRDNLDFNPESDAEVSIDPLKGVCLNGFDISLDSDLDFMVASAAQNKTENAGSLGNSAVTTRFSHQLSRVRVTAHTGEDYTQSKEITVNSITFKNIARQADYQQSSCEDGKWSEIHQWTVSGRGDAVYGDYTAEPQIITSSVSELDGERVMYIPQTFTEGVEYLQVCYTVKDFFSGLVENVTENISLDSVIGSEGLANGKLYTINITIGLDKVFWDPSVNDWDE